MSRLDELIAELCPDGVEYKTIGELATDIYRGSGITRDQVSEVGTPCVRYGEIYTTYGVWFDSCISHTDESKIANAKYFEHGDILFAITGESVEDIAKSCAYIGDERCLAGGDIVVLKHEQDPKYLSYALSTTSSRMQKSKGKVKSKVVHSSVPAIQEIKVPVPPMEVQREIVRILDDFTQITEELKENLRDELIARQKQYEYYRDLLLTFVESDGTLKQASKQASIAEIRLLQYVFGAVYLPLKYTCEMRAGKAIRASELSETEDNEHPYLCYGGNGVRGFIGKTNYRGGFPIIGRQGALCGNIQFADGEFYATEHAVVVSSKGLYDQRYLYHLLIAMNLNQYKSAGAQPGLAVSKLGTIEAPIPLMEKQIQIAKILDRFDALCNDLSTGLPAEIESRQKQYEYYRDKLLNFKELT